MGSEILETKVKYSKVGNKEIEQKNIFSKTHQTSKVKFYDYNPYEDIKNLLVEVDIQKIVKNIYSLNYQEYLKDEKEKKYNDEISIKKLKDICDFLPKSKRQASYSESTGQDNIIFIRLHKYVKILRFI